MTAEMKLYIELKKHLKNRGWSILGGQPPSGSDHLPVIEIKLHHGVEKGSKDAYKPDLVAFREDVLALFEIKPKFSKSDFLKLVAIEESSQRVVALWKELAERKILGPKGSLAGSSPEKVKVISVLAYESPRVPVQRVWTFLYNEGTFEEHPPQE